MYQESILLCQSHKFTRTKNWSTTSSAPPETCSSFIIKKEPRQVGREQKIYELYINILAYFTTPSILPGFNSLKWNQNLINLYCPIFFAVLWFFVVTCLSCKNLQTKGNCKSPHTYIGIDNPLTCYFVGNFNNKVVLYGPKRWCHSPDSSPTWGKY